MNDIIIRSEGDIYRLLEQFAAGDTFDETGEVKFENWPVISIRLDGKKFEQSITPSVMRGLIELQGSIYRSYAHLKYSSLYINRLTASEKQALELVIKVEKGSSNLNINLTEILERFVIELKHMDTAKVLGAVGIISVAYASQAVFNHWVSENAKVKISELETQRDTRRVQEEKELLRSLIQQQNEEESRRLEIFSSAVTQSQALLAPIRDESENARVDLLKSLRVDGEVELHGSAISGEAAHSLTKNARTKTIETRLDGDYFVKVVDSSDPSKFRISVESTGGDDRFQAIVQDDKVGSDSKKLIQSAEWGRTSVNLKINAKIRRDQIVEAVVLEAVKNPASNN